MFSKLLYPRPQMIRKNWMDFNGEWKFAFDDENLGLKNQLFMTDDFYDKVIQVPYSYHTKNSGIGLNEDHPIVWYKRNFTVNVKEDKRYILYFGAVDYKCDIWLNGHHIFTHLGGHTPFEVDLSSHIETENTIIIRCEDYNRCDQPIGKQSWKQ